MKTNKKAILGMLVAMIMSLGVMNGINNQKDSSETYLAWCALTAFSPTASENTPTENFAAGAMGCVLSAATGAIYGAAFGGPIGAGVGLVMGL